ncbi:MAG: hypothetical protein JW730_12760 [Anaerolineales bacterium]|nr:hypothetical protein [Anaerolineales bacterium]
MQPRPSFDRGLPILIAIGAVSILGIGWIVLTSDLGKSLIPPTAIPSSFSSLEAGTPTATQSPSAPPTQDDIPPTATGTSPDAYPGPPAETLPSTSTLITESLPTPSATYTPDQIQPLRAGKYDDTDPNIAYDRFWTVLKNPGTANAYKGTIHISAGIGNEASFRFTGERFHLGYQRGKNFGIVTVIIDDQSYSFHEQAFDLLWRSPQLSPGDHFVRIIHESGESINLDYIVILD